MPLFTVVLCKVLFNEKQTTSVYISLVPIITGVAIATLTEFSFNFTGKNTQQLNIINKSLNTLVPAGLLTALMATCGFSLQNIFSKRVLRQTNTHQFYLLALLARLSLLFFLPFWISKYSTTTILTPSTRSKSLINLLQYSTSARC